MLATRHAQLTSLLIALLIVLIIAAVVWFACRAAGRPDLGAAGAALIAIIGGIIVLLDYT